jgi:hypothetical protein
MAEGVTNMAPPHDRAGVVHARAHRPANPPRFPTYILPVSASMATLQAQSSLAELAAPLHSRLDALLASSSFHLAALMRVRANVGEETLLPWVVLVAFGKRNRRSVLCGG